MSAESGASLSVKYCRELGTDWQPVMKDMLKYLEVKRLRLMSYWDATRGSHFKLIRCR